MDRNINRANMDLHLELHYGKLSHSQEFQKCTDIPHHTSQIFSQEAQCDNNHEALEYPNCHCHRRTKNKSVSKIQIVRIAYACMTKIVKVGQQKTVDSVQSAVDDIQVRQRPTAYSQLPTDNRQPKLASHLHN